MKANTLLLFLFAALVLAGIGAVGYLATMRHLAKSAKEREKEAAYAANVERNAKFAAEDRERQLKQQEQIAYVAASRDWSDEQIAEKTRRFIFEIKSNYDEPGEREALKEHGPRTHAVVLEILQDPTLRQKLISPADAHELPIHRACVLLEKRPPASVVEAIAPFLEDESIENRAQIAYILVATGAPTAAPYFDRVVKTGVYGKVLDPMLVGLEHAIEQEQVDDDARAAFFETLRAKIVHGSFNSACPQLLYDLDAGKATACFLSDEVLTHDCQSLECVIKLCSREKVPPPRERLLKLLDEWADGELDEDQKYRLSLGLYWLALLRNPEDRPRFERYLTNPDWEIALYARDGLLRSYGIEDYHDRLREKEQSQGFATLTRPQQYYLAATELDAFSRGNGLADYFQCPEADRWPVALEGLVAMNCPERARAFRDCLLAFPQARPSLDLDRRRQEVTRILDNSNWHFGFIDSKYKSRYENFELFRMRFILQHPEDFK